ncbi:hypothetical protein D3C71_1600090 [compost metagenome]
MISTEGSTQHAVPWFKFRGDGDSCYRESIPHSFSHGIDVRVYAGLIMRIKFSRSSITALYAISDVKRIVLIAKGTDFLKERNRCFFDSTDTLNPFNDYCCDFISESSKCLL